MTIFIRSLLTLLLLSSSLQVQAKLEEGSQAGPSQVDQLGKLPYAQAMPQLRAAAGPKGADKIAELNSIYREMKGRSPTVEDVFKVYQSRHGGSKSAMDPGLLCGLIIGGIGGTTAAAAGVVATVGAKMLIDKLDQLATPKTKSSPDQKACDKKVGQIVEQSQGPRAAEIQGGGTP